MSARGDLLGTHNVFEEEKGTPALRGFLGLEALFVSTRNRVNIEIAELENNIYGREKTS